MIAWIGGYFRGVNLFLGHGRALEGALVFVKLQFGLMLTASSLDLIDPPFVIALNDLAGVVPLWVQSLPFWVTGVVQAVGLHLNAAGYASCKYLRIVGASMGMAIWTYILTKNILLGVVAAGVNPWCLMGILASVWIVRRGALGLPRPGAPGLSEVPEPCPRT